MEAVKGAPVTALVKKEESFDLANFADAERRAEILSKSNLLPPDLKGKAADVLVVMVTGHELGLQPMQAIRGIHVVKGRPVLSADLMVALCKRSSVCQFFRMVSSSGKEATYETHRAGDPQPTKMTWTIEQAQAAGLMSNPSWKNHPDAMLRARCSAALARVVYPDVVGGMYEEDEGQEIAGDREPRRVQAVSHYQGQPPAPAAAQPDVVEGEIVETPHDPVTGEVKGAEELTFEEQVAGWRGLIEQCETAEQLEAIGRDLGAQYPKGHAVRKAVNDAYNAKQAALRRG